MNLRTKPIAVLLALLTSLALAPGAFSQPYDKEDLPMVKGTFEEVLKQLEDLVGPSAIETGSVAGTHADMARKKLKEAKDAMAKARKDGKMDDKESREVVSKLEHARIDIAKARKAARVNAESWFKFFREKLNGFESHLASGVRSGGITPAEQKTLQAQVAGYRSALEQVAKDRLLGGKEYKQLDELVRALNDSFSKANPSTVTGKTLNQKKF